MDESRLGVELLEPAAGDHTDLHHLGQGDDHVDHLVADLALGGRERVVQVEQGQCSGHGTSFGAAYGWRPTSRWRAAGRASPAGRARGPAPGTTHHGTVPRRADGIRAPRRQAAGRRAAGGAHDGPTYARAVTESRWDVLDWRRQVAEPVPRGARRAGRRRGAPPLGRRPGTAAAHPPRLAGAGSGAACLRRPTGGAVRRGVPLRRPRGPVGTAAASRRAHRDRRRGAARAGGPGRACRAWAAWTCGGWPCTAAASSCRSGMRRAAVRRTAAAATCSTPSRVPTSAGRRTRWWST